jgi:hypothetical protein
MILGEQSIVEMLDTVMQVFFAIGQHCILVFVTEGLLTVFISGFPGLHI